ncbi:MAG: hypothetical protein ACLFNU_03720 [Bacteroidales bacterium]
MIKKITDRIKQLSITELLLIGTVIILMILIINEWNRIWEEVTSSFSSIFS